MTRRLTVFATLAVLAAACGGSEAPSAAPSLEARGAWARPADSGMVTAVYLAIINPEAAPVSLIGAVSPLAESVSLHETMAMNGMVHMMPLDTAQVIAANDSLVMAEGAKHLMVSGLRRKLSAGDSLPLTLSFGDGRTLEMKAPVRAP